MHGLRKALQLIAGAQCTALPLMCAQAPNAAGPSERCARVQALYQHKRNNHPELIGDRGYQFTRQEHASYSEPLERRFKCPSLGCGKAYASSAGLYQHKRAAHPYLIKRRKTDDDDDTSAYQPIYGGNTSTFQPPKHPAPRPSLQGESIPSSVRVPGQLPNPSQAPTIPPMSASSSSSSSTTMPSDGPARPENAPAGDLE